MFGRIRVTLLAAMAAGALLAVGASAAHANVLSLLPGSCGSQPESQPFAHWGDYNSYTLVPGGTFEPGSTPWGLSGSARVLAGNESYYASGSGSFSLGVPAWSSAMSPASCTSIYHPTVRFFVRNTGSSSSHLIVQALYPTLLGTAVSNLGEVSGSSRWQPSPAMSLLLNNLLSTVSLNETTIAVRFVPADSSGSWSVDDVYLDPYLKG